MEDLAAYWKWRTAVKCDYLYEFFKFDHETNKEEDRLKKNIIPFQKCSFDRCDLKHIHFSWLSLDSSHQSSLNFLFELRFEAFHILQLSLRVKWSVVNNLGEAFTMIAPVRSMRAFIDTNPHLCKVVDHSNSNCVIDGSNICHQFWEQSKADSVLSDFPACAAVSITSCCINCSF